MGIAVGIYFRKLPTRSFHLLHKICRTLYELECNRVGAYRSYDGSDVGVSDRPLSRPRIAGALLQVLCSFGRISAAVGFVGYYDGDQIKTGSQPSAAPTGPVLFLGHHKFHRSSSVAQTPRYRRKHEPL